ncbi:MAG TPA: NADH-quinone oxidoreductase subunit H [Terriglobales bacterium]|nr:NADH-quinone oxidoreductase subunit H [Terriglobales bacterium]
MTLPAALANLAQWALLLALAPLLRGLIQRAKARAQNRRGASLWRPYAELAKLLRKQDLVPDSASPVFRAAPLAALAATLVAAALVPVLWPAALLASSGDFLVLVGLLALARLALLLGAWDSGSAFAGMGASREAMVSALAEAPLLLGLLAVAILAGSASLAGMAHWTLTQTFATFSPVHALAASALVLVALAEAGRIPVDNPATHLELTMIHEAMVLEYSGPSLALLELAAALKLTLLLALLAALFFPWGMAPAPTPARLALALLLFLFKLALGAAAIALVESTLAKLRMYQVPAFLGLASALAFLAVASTSLTR